MTILLSIQHIDVLNWMRNDYDTLLELENVPVGTPGLARDTERVLNRLRFPVNVPLAYIAKQARDERRMIHFLLNAHMSRLAFTDGNERPMRNDLLELIDRHLEGIDVAKRAGKWHQADDALDTTGVLQTWREWLETPDQFQTLPVRIING